MTDGSVVNMAWEYNALKAAHRTASLILGPLGKPTNINLDTFVCTRGFAPHQRAIEILGAMGKGFIPGSADRDSSGVPTYKVLPLPWVTTNTSYWWMYDSSLKGPTYGLQYRESQPIQLEGPNVVLKFLTPLWETIKEKFRKFRGTLQPQTILSEALYKCI